MMGLSPRYEGHVSNRIETIVDRKGVEMRRNANFRAQRHSDPISGDDWKGPRRMHSTISWEKGPDMRAAATSSFRYSLTLGRYWRTVW